jgi:hypothetical protein
MSATPHLPNRSNTSTVSELSQLTSSSRIVLSEVSLGSDTLEQMGRRIYLDLQPKRDKQPANFYLIESQLAQQSPILDLTVLPQSERTLVLKGMASAFSDHVDNLVSLNNPVSPQLALELYMAGAEINIARIETVFKRWLSLHPGNCDPHLQNVDYHYAVLAYLRAYEEHTLNSSAFDALICRALNNFSNQSFSHDDGLSATRSESLRPLQIISDFDAKERIRSLVDAKLTKKLISNQLSAALELDLFYDASQIVLEFNTVFKQLSFYLGERVEFEKLVPALRSYLGSEQANNALTHYIRATTYHYYRAAEDIDVDIGDTAKEDGLDCLATIIRLATSAKERQGFYLELLPKIITDLNQLDLRVDPETYLINERDAERWHRATERIVLKIIRELSLEHNIEEDQKIEIVSAFIMLAYPCQIKNLATSVGVDHSKLSQVLLSLADKMLANQVLSINKGSIKADRIAHAALNLLYNGIELLNGAKIAKDHTVKYIDLLDKLSPLLNLKLYLNADKLRSLVGRLNTGRMISLRNKKQDLSTDNEVAKLVQIRHKCIKAILQHGGFTYLEAKGELPIKFKHKELGSYWKTLFKAGHYLTARDYLANAKRDGFTGHNLAEFAKVVKFRAKQEKGSSPLLYQLHTNRPPSVRAEKSLLAGFNLIIQYLDDSQNYSKKEVREIASDLITSFLLDNINQSSEHREAHSVKIVENLTACGFRKIAIEFTYQILSTTGFEPKLSLQLLQKIQFETTDNNHKWEISELESFRSMYLKVLRGVELEQRKKFRLNIDNDESRFADTTNEDSSLDSILLIYGLGQEIFSSDNDQTIDGVLKQIFAERALAWTCSILNTKIANSNTQDSYDFVKGDLKSLLDSVLTLFKNITPTIISSQNIAAHSKSLAGLYKSRETYRLDSTRFALKLLKEQNASYRGSGLRAGFESLFRYGYRIASAVGANPNELNKYLEQRYQIAIINADCPEALRLKSALGTISHNEVQQLFNLALSQGQVEWASLFYAAYQSQDPASFFQFRSGIEFVFGDEIEASVEEIPTYAIEQIGSMLAGDNRSPERLIVLELALDQAGYLNDRDPFRFETKLHAKLLPSLIEEIATGSDYCTDRLFSLYFDGGDSEFKNLVKELLLEKFAESFCTELKPISVAQLAFMMDLEYADKRFMQYAKEYHAKSDPRSNYDISLLYRFREQSSWIDNHESKKEIFGSRNLIWPEVVETLCPSANHQAIISSMAGMQTAIEDGIYQFLEQVNALDKWLGALSDHKVNEAVRRKNELTLSSIAQAATSTELIVNELKRSELSRIREIVVTHPEGVLRNVKLDWNYDDYSNAIQNWDYLETMLACTSIPKYQKLVRNVRASLRYFYEDHE